MKRTKVFYRVAVLAVSVVLLTVVNVRAVSEEARRHMDRGQAAIEMAKTPRDFEDAIKEFQEAARLAPDWPDPYYNLGMVQNKIERFGDALNNLTRYLQLAPNARNAQEVKQLINKIEYKKEKANESQAIIKTLTGPGALRWKSGDRQPTWPSGFRLRNGKLEAAVHLSTGKRWIPVAYDGKQLQCEFTWYHCGFEMHNGCPWQVSVKSEIISTSPLRLKNKAVWAQQYGDRAVNEEEYVLEWVNDR